MRYHPELGAAIARAMPGWTRSVSGSCATTSALTASGYPRGLRGDEIPLEARILAVADSYEAMTNDRVYRRAIGRWRAREELRRNAGTQFDEDGGRGVPAGRRTRSACARPSRARN